MPLVIQSTILSINKTLLVHVAFAGKHYIEHIQKFC